MNCPSATQSPPCICMSNHLYNRFLVCIAGPVLKGRRLNPSIHHGLLSGTPAGHNILLPRLSSQFYHRSRSSSQHSNLQKTSSRNTTSKERCFLWMVGTRLSAGKYKVAQRRYSASVNKIWWSRSASIYIFINFQGPCYCVLAIFLCLYGYHGGLKINQRLGWRSLAPAPTRAIANWVGDLNVATILSTFQISQFVTNHSSWPRFA